jgi:hypothetical protein
MKDVDFETSNFGHPLPSIFAPTISPVPTNHLTIRSTSSPMSSSTSTPIFLRSIEATPNPSSATVKRSTPPTTLSNPSPTTAIIFTLVPSTGQWEKATVNDTLPPAMEGFGSDCDEDTTLVSAGMDLGTLQTAPLFFCSYSHGIVSDRQYVI